MSNIVDSTGEVIQDKKDFRCQIKLNYSDSDGNATEQSALFGAGTSFDDYMATCRKMYEVVAYTYGEGFEEVSKGPKKSQTV